MSSPVVAAVLAIGLAAVHVFAGRLRSLRTIPRSRALSLAGGVSIAYVFVHLLPEIAERQSAVAEGTTEAAAVGGSFGERVLFLIALVGFATFYGLERLAVRSRRSAGPEPVGVGGDGPETRTSERTFWLHVGSFAVYSGLVGYLLVHREETGLRSLLLYAVALGLHFFVNDFGLREHHREAYARVGRWLLGGSVLLGTGIGALVALPEPLLGGLLAFLGGGVVLNVVKEELPEERESSFWAFAGGVGGYSVVLLLA